MGMPIPVEKLGRRLVEEVRDRLVMGFFDTLSGDARSRIQQNLCRDLRDAGITEAQHPALRRFVVYCVDQVLAEALGFCEYHVTVGNLEIVVTDRNLEGEVGSGESYRIKDTDMIAAEYSSGDGTWVDKYGKVRE
jgi:hypothetical protein